MLEKNDCMDSPPAPHIYFLCLCFSGQKLIVYKLLYIAYLLLPYVSFKGIL
jgi:hypothetical protein